MVLSFFFGPESDHWQPSSCKAASSKLVEVVTVADVDNEDHVGNSFLQIWELTFGPKTKLFFRL